MERAQLNLSLQYKITKHMGKPLILSESRKTTNGRLRPLRLKILEWSGPQYLKNSLFIKMFREIKMLPGKPGKYENEQVDSEMKTIMLKFKTQRMG